MIVELPTVSIIIPMFNEVGFIENCLAAFTKQDYPISKYRIIVVDGNSNDGSKKIVRNFIKNHASIVLLENKKRLTPISFNIGIKYANTEVVGIFSAHSVPSLNYISTAVDILIETKADCVGGPMKDVSSTFVGKAIAHATSTPFGVGNSVFHYSDKPGYVNTVYQGFFYKRLFDEIGYFDEDLIRNQDDEMSYRIQKFGGKIYYDPNIKSVYHSRSNLKKLFIQYFQYGVFKPLVFFKTNHGMQVHHFIPTTFVFCLFCFLLFPQIALFKIPIISYLMICLYFSLFSKIPLLSKLFSLIVYPLIHIGYGMGFIAGLFKLPGRLLNNHQ